MPPAGRRQGHSRSADTSQLLRRVSLVAAARCLCVSAAQNDSTPTSAAHVRLSLSPRGHVLVSWSSAEGSDGAPSGEHPQEVRYAPVNSDLASGNITQAVQQTSWLGRRWSVAELECANEAEEYAYQIDTGNGSVFGEHFQCRAPSPSSGTSSSSSAGSVRERPFRLALIGDLPFGADGSTSHEVLRVLSEEAWDAAIHLGDLAGNLSDQEGLRGEQFLEMIQPLASRVPYMTLAGDRDKLAFYSRFFRMPSSGNDPWYAFSLGPARFIMLWTESLANLGADFQDTQAKRQLAWLERELEQANTPETRTKQPWLLVAGHRPLYCSVLRPTCSTEAARLRAVLEPLLGRYKVDMYLSAHVHAYERTFAVLNGSLCASAEHCG
ncbi:unnamed protein product, partial [Polarella glacialis]